MVRKYVFFIVLLVTAIQANAQVTDHRDDYLKENDTLLGVAIELEEVIIDKNQIKISEDARKKFAILQRRVFKVYPYAKLASERLVQLNKGMVGLKTNREKKKYFKITEDYLTNEFEEQLKKLSRKDGQILVKLIHRQTGNTTFNLIKSLKSSWKAFWSNSTARVFDINLKTEYDPMEVYEDYLIETIIDRGFKSRSLVPQTAAKPIDADEMAAIWSAKIEKQKASVSKSK
jgi:ABC-type transporter MlaC component